jgi:formylglycine-generating enzyme required for sulfatase activity
VGLPATTVSETATVPTKTPLAAEEESSGIGEATALPVTITPTTIATLDPNLTGPVVVFEGEFTYGATTLQSEQALELCGQLGGTCRAEFFEDSEPAVPIQLGTFYIDRTEVTNTAYRECVEAGICGEPEGLDVEGLGIADYYRNEANSNYPVVGVTWDQANTYCRWAGGRLPTEAEWEKAASWDEDAGEKRIWPWGQNWDPALVNFRNPDNPGGGPEEVGSRPGNVSAYGVLDMAGNVSEWVADWYADDYFQNLVSGQVNPLGPGGPGEARNKVLRGGSWEDNGVFTRTVHRLFVLDDHFNKSIGIRCAYDESPEPSPGPGASGSDAPPLISGGQVTRTPSP